MSETIEIIGASYPNNAKWQPYKGEEIISLMRHKGFTDGTGSISAAGEKVIDETFKILEVCGDPSGPAIVETGLVIGYVQSGKTLSFTSLTALANDNHYQMVIIIAGTSTPLSEQSYERMRKDLRIEERFDRKWTIIKNAGTLEDRDTIEMKLEQWSDSTYPRENCSTLLITVMKQAMRLNNLTSIFRGLNLTKVPTLIIDDESDQASLNTRARANATSGENVNEGQASTIYRRINELRSIFPHHTFLQYTATPQANLFINIMDRLSPNFIKLLTPGESYTGGNVFFRQNPHLVSEIPLNEIPTNNNPLHEPPDTLLYALKIFLLGVVVGETKKDQKNRSMMVHPSRLTNSQSVFANWIRNACESWKRLLQSTNPADEAEKQVLLEDFQEAYNDLTQTVRGLPTFENLIGNRLLHAIKNTRVIEVNASRGRTPEIRWNDFYSYILIGGQAMDRGFTVEGLTVTYMPRSLATGQVDTTLQRARFFGYKGSYLGFCRVWLDQANIAAFRAIIEHEEDVRRRLEEFDVNNRPLNEWEREAVLDQMLNLTRPSILYNNIDRDNFGEGWFWVKAPHDTDNLIPYNSETIESFITNYAVQFSEDKGSDGRTLEQRNVVAELPLNECVSTLLNKLKFTREGDSQTFSNLRSILKMHLKDNPNERCAIYFISSRMENGTIKQNIRERRLHRNGTDTIEQIFQGPNVGTGFPGGRNIKNENQVTIQIYCLKILDSNGNAITDENGNLLYENVPTIAVWIPDTIGEDIIRQPDNIA